MPIARQYRKLYKTPQWEAARQACRERAGDRCERCGAKNGATGFRERGRRFVEIAPRDAELARMKGHRVILIQCGACHRVPVPVGDMYSLSNLIWLDRGCHLRFDAALHRRSRQARKDGARPLLAEAMA